MANTSAIWQQASHTTYQLSSPSCSTRAIQKSLTLNEKYLRVFWKQSQENGPLAEKWHDRKSKRTRQKNTREEIGKGNQMTALRFQTEENIRPPRPPFGVQIATYNHIFIYTQDHLFCTVCTAHTQYTYSYREKQIYISTHRDYLSTAHTQYTYSYRDKWILYICQDYLSFVQHIPTKTDT